MRVFFILSILYGGAAAFAQNPKFQPLHDNQWLFGYTLPPPDSTTHHGESRVIFHTNPPEVIRKNRVMDIDVNNTSQCDAQGNLLFYTNGLYIVNAAQDTMKGGHRINPAEDVQTILMQGLLALPLPETDQVYYLIHSESTFDPTPYNYSQVYRCFYSVIDMKNENSLGEVVQANTIFLKDTLCYGKLTATKHANGRDWWLLIPKWNSAITFKFLLTPDGLQSHGTQNLGTKPIPGAGQAVFSPDGTKYVRYNVVGAEFGSFLDIFDFDRCSGMLSNPINIHQTTQVGMPGAAISPNSRYLYVSNGLWLHQYDLHAANVAASKMLIGTYDGYVSPQSPTTFFMLQLAPNGKLYMNCPSLANTLHVIHSPDLPGTACRFEQHDLQLPVRNLWSLPNFPYYRLGPLDGSPCDTLGIDNLPAAHYRWEFWDTLSPLRVFFSDLSIYEPADWQWDFGDGATSTEQNPVHVYASPGVYTVCLRVQNDYGADTACYEVTVGITSTNPEVSGAQSLEVSVVPNPFHTVLAFAVPVEPWVRVDARLYDLTGREVAHTAWRGSSSDWLLEHLPQGVYLYELVAEDGRRKTGKVLKW